MIAPLRQPDGEPPTAPARRELRRARRLAAAMLFAAEPDARPAPPVPKWQAWLVTGWAVLVALAYVAQRIP